MSVNERDLPKEVRDRLHAIRLHEGACLDAIDAFGREVLIAASLDRGDEHEFLAKVNGAAAEIARVSLAVRDDVKRPFVDLILQEREEADQG